MTTAAERLTAAAAFDRVWYWRTCLPQGNALPHSGVWTAEQHTGGG